MSQPSQNRILIILILGALSTISPFAIDMYLPAFPGIAAALHTSTAKVSLSISSYFVGLAVGQLFYGPLLDRFGRKLPLYAGLTLFIVASLLCVLSRTVEWLVAMRFLQALGGCAAQVASMAMVRDFFPVHETARIISLLILILGVSPLLAPTVGGYVALHLGWPANSPSDSTAGSNDKPSSKGRSPGATDATHTPPERSKTKRCRSGVDQPAGDRACAVLDSAAGPLATSSIVHHSNQSDTRCYASCQVGYPTWTMAVQLTQK